MTKINFIKYEYDWLNVSVHYLTEWLDHLAGSLTE